MINVLLFISFSKITLGRENIFDKFSLFDFCSARQHIWFSEFYIIKSASFDFHVRMSIYNCFDVSACACMHIYVCACMHACMHACMGVWTLGACTCVFICTLMCVRMHACMYIFAISLHKYWSWHRWLPPTPSNIEKLSTHMSQAAILGSPFETQNYFTFIS